MFRNTLDPQVCLFNISRCFGLLTSCIKLCLEAQQVLPTTSVCFTENGIECVL